MHPYLSLPTIESVDPSYWSGKRVLVRADLNVPESEGEHDFMRVDALVPTLQFLIQHDARVVVISHRGDGLSLSTVAEYLEKTFRIAFVRSISVDGDYLGNHAHTGVVTILENLRFDPREEANDSSFVDELVRGFDVFVQDAFSACHRPHASIVGIPARLPSYLGLQAAREVAHLAGKEQIGGLALVIGGAKFGTKLPLIERYLDRAEVIYVGGALVHSIYRSRGYEIGKSVFDDSVSVAHIARHPRVQVPQYVVVQRADGTTGEVLATAVGATDCIVDAGPAAIGTWNTVETAPVVIWNGPLGWYEKGFTAGTQALIGRIAQNPGETIVGGGDTVSTLEALNAQDSFSFVSLAGGAMLDFLSEGKLVGLEVLVDKK